MEFEVTNHQEVAEPDQAGSRAAFMGLNEKSKTGSVDYVTMEDSGEFFSYEGFKRIQESKKDPEGFTQSPKAREKTGKKDRIVVGMGVLDNRWTQPGTADNTQSTEAGVPGPAGSTGTSRPADPGAEPDDSHLDLIFALCERQERVSERLNRKIERLDQKLTTRFDRKYEVLDRKLNQLENRKVRE